MPRTLNKRMLLIALLVLVAVSLMSCMKGATLTSITVTPDRPIILLGSGKQFTATATFSDGMTLNWTTAVTWSSDNPEVTVSNTVGSIGVATAALEQTSTVTITATDVANNAIVGSTTVTVANAPLYSIIVSPENPEISVTNTQQFHAQGLYEDNVQRDITHLVTWSSSNPGIASISNASGSFGLATGLAIGTTEILAKDPETQVPGNTILTVNQ